MRRESESVLPPTFWIATNYFLSNKRIHLNCNAFIVLLSTFNEILCNADVDSDRKRNDVISSSYWCNRDVRNKSHLWHTASHFFVLLLYDVIYTRGNSFSCAIENKTKEKEFSFAYIAHKARKMTRSLSQMTRSVSQWLVVCHKWLAVCHNDS